MRLIDQQYTRTPFYGSRRMTTWLGKLGYEINRKRVQRLMRQMGLEAIYPRPHTSQAHPAHRIYPYLLRRCLSNTKTQSTLNPPQIGLDFGVHFSITLSIDG